MPAAKSTNKLPSMSSTVRPSPRTGTIGYARGRLGDVHVSSNATWACAFGPGSSVTMCGTGRSPAIRDAPDDKVHLFVWSGVHNAYADWISLPSIPGHARTTQPNAHRTENRGAGRCRRRRGPSTGASAPHG